MEIPRSENLEYLRTIVKDIDKHVMRSPRLQERYFGQPLTTNDETPPMQVWQANTVNLESFLEGRPALREKIERATVLWDSREQV